MGLYGNISAVTNNPLVYETYKEKMDITLLDGQYMDVLIYVRDKIHQGFGIITHPLMGSVKPNETPYRSLIIEKKMEFDMTSLNLIESSIQSCERFIADRPVPAWGEKALYDFRVVDRHLFDSAVGSIGLF